MILITTYEQSGGTLVIMEHQKPQQRQKFRALLNSDHSNDTDQEDVPPPSDRAWSPRPSNDAYSSPPTAATSPWSQASSFAKSPWITASPAVVYSPYGGEGFPRNSFLGSLYREEGHVYSLAVSGDLLYTGSDSKNIRVWKNLKDFTGFKCSSGLVKAIVIAGGDRIFTGHQDGKIRVWRVSRSNPKTHRRIGTLPSFKDSLVSSVNPKNYVEVRRKRNVLRIRHFDAVSSMSLDEEEGILYSASWDKTVKVWRVATSKCLESFVAHDDAVNAVEASGIGGLVFTGSADGTVKAWRRRISNRDGTTEHFLVQTLLRQENAVTALAVSKANSLVYGGSSDGLVNFWELNGKRLSHGGVLRGHKLAVLCLAAAGNLVFSGSADRNICVWRRDQASGLHACLSILTGHTGPVKCLAVTAEGRSDDHNGGDDNEDNHDHDRRWIVYSGSLDKSVKLWRVSENAPELKQLRAWEQQCESNVYAPSPKVSYPVGRLSHKNLLGQY